MSGRTTLNACVMLEKNSCVAVYADHRQIEHAVDKLQTSDCDLKRVSVIAKCSHAQQSGCYTIDSQLHYIGAQNSFWDSLWQRLNGAAFFWIPGYGILTAAGQIVALMEHGLRDVELGSGFSVLGAALFNAGVPRDNIREYEQAIRENNFLLLVNDKRDDIERVCDILHNEMQQVTVHRA